MRGRRDMEGQEIKEKKEDNTTEGGGAKRWRKRWWREMAEGSR